MWSTFQQSSRLDRIAFQEENATFPLCIVHSPDSLPSLTDWLWGVNADFLCLWSPLQAVPLTRQIGCEVESVEFLMVFSSSVSLARWICWQDDDCKDTGSAAWFPAGSWGTLEMHSLVEIQGCPDTDVLAVSVLSGLIFSQHLGNPPWQHSLFLWFSLCQCTGLSWPGYLFSWLAGDTHFLHALEYTVIHCFPSSTTSLLPCDITKQGRHIALLRGNPYIYWTQITVSSGCTFMSSGSAILYMMVYSTVLTKAKRYAVYIWVPDRPQISTYCGQKPISSMLGKLAQSLNVLGDTVVVTINCESLNICAQGDSTVPVNKKPSKPCIRCINWLNVLNFKPNTFTTIFKLTEYF